MTHDALMTLAVLLILGFTALTAYGFGYRQGDRDGRRVEWRQHRRTHLCTEDPEVSHGADLRG